MPPLETAVEVPPEPETEAPEAESPEMIRARKLIEKIEALEPARSKLSSISGKRCSERLANSRRLLESRIASIPDFERHSRKCQVCHSRWVEEIEEAYYNWSSAQWIINAFHISYDDSVYRHARAIGLDARRRKNVAIAVEKLIEKVDQVTVTSSTVLRAIRALSLLDDNGHWTDPPSTHIFVRGTDAASSCSGVPQQSIDSASATDHSQAARLESAGDQPLPRASLATSHSPLATESESNRGNMKN